MVIDTMVFAYALLHVEDKYEQAIAALETVDQIVVPDSLFAPVGECDLAMDTISATTVANRFRCAARC
ncbi:MAG: hypothetical protein PUP92_04855 [Rhizonema sp. PD38]|nr:hypothetical protein [Rhizonema sp. PD38]